METTQNRHARRVLAGLLAAGALAAVPARAVAPTPNVIRAIDVAERGEAVELDIRGSRAPSYTVFKLQDPPRLVVDVAGGDVSALSSPLGISRRGVLSVTTAQYKDEKSAVVDISAVRSVFEKARIDNRLSIGDAESRTILQAYGLRIPRSELAETPVQASLFAGKIGYPVVLKIASPDSLHKTDIGGEKRVGLHNSQDVKDAFELMVYRAQRYLPEARIRGCLVQEMAPTGGLEVLVGMNRDPQFGPLVTFGLGGIYVETLLDVTFRVAPFSRQEAEEMLTQIRAHALLDGVRGQLPVDKSAIVDTLLRISQLVQDFPEIIELDINPLMVYHQGGADASCLDRSLAVSVRRQSVRLRLSRTGIWSGVENGDKADLSKSGECPGHPYGHQRAPGDGRDQYPGHLGSRGRQDQRRQIRH